MALAPGTKLGSYEIVAPLGAGGMGEVYRARDPQLGRDVAIKILPSFLSRDPDRLRRFEQEARAAAALSHPNILAVYQMGTHEGSPYLVSELLEGSTLRGLLLRGPLPIRKAVEYGTQMAHGLAAAHEKGIVHRDLKPENLFVTKDGRIKILDFGLAKLIQNPQASDPGTPTMTEGTEPGVVLGTVGYMAPEQVRGQATDHRTDLFALGAILYEMLTGKRSFHKPTSAETMSAILNEEPPPVSQIVPDIPPALQKVVRRCLEKSPEQRFHSASDLAFGLEALSDSGSAPTGAFAAVKRQTSWKWIAIAATAMVIIAATMAWFLRPPAIPVVESVVQLTNDGQTKGTALETDGSRIYLDEGALGSYRVVQVSTNGGQTGDIPTNLVNVQIAGLAGDGSAMLVLTGAPVRVRASMWLLPLPAGEARRLGDVSDASLFPDGRLLYAVDSAVFIAEKDGSNPRKLEGITSQFGDAPIVSPDGKRLVFTIVDTKTNAWTIEEAAADGTDVHAVLKAGPGLPTSVCCARWTADGKYLLFSGQSPGRSDLWALSEEEHLLGGPRAPVQLTKGPLSYGAFAASRDGKQIFAVGVQRRGELVRYDAKAGEFVPFLGGISAFDPTFSHDGKWVAYLSYPDHTLWRSRADGSDRMQLTYPPLLVTYPRISPDGSKVAFNDDSGNAYVIGMDGGTPQKLMDNAEAPDWAPDGKSLVVTSGIPEGEPKDKGVFQSRIVDLRTGGASVLPDSQGTLGPWFVAQDALIATAADQSKLVLFNLKTRKWSDLISSRIPLVNWESSPDGKYFFYATGGNDPKIFRMRVVDHVVEEVASLKNLGTVNDPYTGSAQLSVSPDNSPVTTRDVGTQEVYAITVKWP